MYDYILNFVLLIIKRKEHENHIKSYVFDILLDQLKFRDTRDSRLMITNTFKKIICIIRISNNYFYKYHCKNMNMQ